MPTLVAGQLESRLTPQFSGGALTYVFWHFIPHRPLQLLVRRLACAHCGLPHGSKFSRFEIAWCSAT